MMALGYNGLPRNRSALLKTSKLTKVTMNSEYVHFAITERILEDNSIGLSSRFGISGVLILTTPFS